MRRSVAGTAVRAMETVTDRRAGREGIATAGMDRRRRWMAGGGEARKRSNRVGGGKRRRASVAIWLFAAATSCFGGFDVVFGRDTGHVSEGGVRELIDHHRPSDDGNSQICAVNSEAISPCSDVIVYALIYIYIYISKNNNENTSKKLFVV